MLTFQEFMKKKKIDLAAMRQGEPSLFTEFERHYVEMGEKSFDHTKKYWFNKLRRQYHLAPEIVTEKVHHENKLAEQTIADTLTTGPAANAPAEEQPVTYQEKSKIGFTPKFRASNTPKPIEDTQQPKAEEPTNDISSEEKPATAPPKLGFTPKFRTASAPKPVEDVQQPKVEEPANDKPSKEKPADAPSKLGFTPKFRTANTPKPAEDAQQPKAEEPVSNKPSEEKPEATPPKLGFTPKFRASNAPKPIENAQESSADEEVKNISPEEKTAPPKLGFTPKFRAANAPTPAEDTQQPAAAAENATAPSEENDVEKTAKPAYKPRFNIKNLPPKPPQE